MGKRRQFTKPKAKIPLEALTAEPDTTPTVPTKQDQQSGVATVEEKKKDEQVTRWKPVIGCFKGEDKFRLRNKIDRHPDEIETKDRGTTALHHAAWNGHLEVVNMLLKAGGCPLARDEAGCTVLHAAAHGGHTAVCEALLDHGVEVDLVNDVGESPLFFAVACNHLEIAKLLLRHGANVNKNDVVGGTPLLLSTDTASAALMKLLLEAGAEVNHVDDRNCTALLVAVYNGKLEHIRLLLDFGADASKLNGNGQSPLHIVACTGNTDIAKILLDAGADLEVKSVNGVTIFHAAATARSIDFASYLISLGAKKCAANCRKCGPVYKLAEKRLRAAQLVEPADGDATSAAGEGSDSTIADESGLKAQDMHGQVSNKNNSSCPQSLPQSTRRKRRIDVQNQDGDYHSPLPVRCVSTQEPLADSKAMRPANQESEQLDDGADEWDSGDAERDGTSSEEDPTFGVGPEIDPRRELKRFDTDAQLSLDELVKFDGDPANLDELKEWVSLHQQRLRIEWEKIRMTWEMLERQRVCQQQPPCC